MVTWPPYLKSDRPKFCRNVDGAKTHVHMKFECSRSNGVSMTISPKAKHANSDIVNFDLCDLEK
jgi:hypothetical protein